jgi:cysteine desulfurase
MSRIYLDTHASAPIRPDILERFVSTSQLLGNPASLHSRGRETRYLLESARDLLKSTLGGQRDDTLILTSGATEANNLALFGQLQPSDHVLACRFEHPCVVGPLERLAKSGVQVEWVPVETSGQALVSSFEKRLRPDTKLAVLMTVNHETGVFQPVSELRKSLPNSVRLHVDAAQSVGRYPIDFQQLGATTLSFSGHKFGAPKGIGGLLIRAGTKITPLFYGGHQQGGLRPGTESPALAEAMAFGLVYATREQESVLPYVQNLKLTFQKLLKENIPEVIFNGTAKASDYVLNASFPIYRAELLQIKLDLAGVDVSTGSACSSGSALPSPALLAMNLPESQVRSAIRFSFGPHLSVEDVTKAAQLVTKAVREMQAARL